MDNSIDRRSLLVGAAASSLIAPIPASAASATIRAIGFDGFPIFDPRGVAGRAKTVIGDKGEMLAAQWATKLFGYSWLETAAGRYQDFATIADASLRHVAAALQVPLSETQRTALVTAYDELDIWPDVRPALEKLRAAGIRLAFVSNLSADTLTANMRRNDIAHYFDPPLSTDRIRAFKPSPKAYSMAIDAWGLTRAEIGFAAFGGWDAVGATWFGYRTAWVNRLGVPAETLDVAPAVTSRGIDGVLALAGVD